MKKLPMKVSFFLHRWETHSVVISMDEFMADVRGSRWKVLALAHRDFLHRGMRKEAAAIKDNLPGITVAGVCHGGHGNDKLRELSQLLMLDLDHTNERTQEIIGLLSGLPYVVAAFVSISGVGSMGRAIIFTSAKTET